MNKNSHPTPICWRKSRLLLQVLGFSPGVRVNLGLPHPQASHEIGHADDVRPPTRASDSNSALSGFASIGLSEGVSLIQSEMSSILMVVRKELTAQPPYVRFIQCDHTIKSNLGVRCQSTFPQFHVRGTPR